MSVAVPRPLNNAAMNHPNIASRPSTSSSSAAAAASSSASKTVPRAGGKVAIPARPNMASRASSASISTVASAAPPASAAGSSKDTSSSAGKVFAKPSKEWVLPERAKPGRKVCAEEPDNKRQSQNRLSQRAHRARRTDYIQTLEERLRQYEADEIHSNVRLQEVARALKTDNERMKNELMLVRGKMNELAAEREGWEVEHKGMQDMCASLMSEVERLRTHVGEASGGGLKLDTAARSSISAAKSSRPHGHGHNHGHAHAPPPPPAPARRTGPTVACPICPDPDPDCPCQQQQQQQIKPSPPATTAAALDCGLCTNPAECLCRAVNESTPTPPKPAMPIPLVKGKCDVCSSLTVCLCEDDSPPRPAVPLARPAVSLRRPGAGARPAGADSKTKLAPLWRLDNVVKKGEAVCTGDPENCDACKNDSFGREFCGHLFEAPADASGTSGIATVKPCNSCPGNCMSISSLLSPPAQDGGVVVQPPTPSPVPKEEDEETMRCDEAWKKLKAHPNAKFASLALLADVVAGRTKCTGPTIELSPAPAPTPTPSPVPPARIARASPIGMGIGVHPAHPTPPPPRPASAWSPVITNHKPISTSSATATGVKRRVAVETSAVRDALRILDSTPSRAASEVTTTPAKGQGEMEVQVKAEPLDLDEVNHRATKKLRLA